MAWSQPAQGVVTMPAYTARARITQYIKHQIASGQWPPDTQLPSRGELATQFGVAASTVQGVTDLLRDSGWLVGVPGKGMFVAEHPPIRRSGKRDMT